MKETPGGLERDKNYSKETPFFNMGKISPQRSNTIRAEAEV